LVLNAPSNSNLPLYIQVLKKHEIKILARTCEPTYSNNELEKAGIKVIDISFPENELPSNKIIGTWLKIIREEKGQNIAIHCISGLGRSLLLVYIALMEFTKMNVIESIEFVHNIQEHATITRKQLNYLYKYKRFVHVKRCGQNFRLFVGWLFYNNTKKK